MLPRGQRLEPIAFDDENRKLGPQGRCDLLPDPLLRLRVHHAARGARDERLVEAEDRLSGSSAAAVVSQSSSARGIGAISRKRTGLLRYDAPSSGEVELIWWRRASSERW
jgi:hypothetical protein